MIDPAQLQAMRFLLTTLRFGEALGAAYEEVVDDPDLATNLPVIVVSALVVRGPLRPTDLAEQTGLSSGGTTKLLERLEQAGIIVRAFGQVPGDRRGVVVHLTPKGMRLAVQLAEGVIDRRAVIEQLVEEMGDLLGETRRLRGTAAG